MLLEPLLCQLKEFGPRATAAVFRQYVDSYDVTKPPSERAVRASPCQWLKLNKNKPADISLFIFGHKRKGEVAFSVRTELGQGISHSLWKARPVDAMEPKQISVSVGPDDHRITTMAVAPSVVNVAKCLVANTEANHLSSVNFDSLFFPDPRTPHVR